MENFLPKMTQVGEEVKKLDTTTIKKASNKNSKELKNPAQELVDRNGRQLEAQSSYVPEQEKPEVSDAGEQALPLPLALRSLQEKMDQNSKETSTKVSHILNKIERVDKDLQAAKSDNLTSEMLQIDVIDDMRDAIGELKNNVGVLLRDQRVNTHNMSSLAHEMWVVKDDVKTVTKNFKNFQEREDLEDEILENEILEVTEDISEVRDKVSEVRDEISKVREEVCEVKDKLKDLEKRDEEKLQTDILEVRDEISEVRNEMCEVRDKVKDLEKSSNELMDVKTALKSLKDEFKDVTKELKDFATNLGRDVMRELKTVKEELRVVKDKTRDANVGQKEMVGVQDVMLYELRKVTDEVSSVKRDLRDIGVEVTDELGMGVGGRLLDVRHELESIRHDMRAAKDEQRELTEADLDLIKEFNETVRSAQIDQAQNVKPTFDDLRNTFKEVMTKLINKKKRKQDSRYPTLKHNKRLRKQGNRGEERGTASVSSASVFRMSAFSSDSNSS